MAQKRDRLRIAVIDLGEAGATFAKGFLVSGLFDVVGYDALIENPSTAEGIRARAESFGIAACASLEQASRDADIILSAVTASAARKVAETAATFLKPGQFYFDINSISPSAKRRNAVAIERSGAAYVEGAVMGPVGPVGIKVEILLAGACAAELAAMLTPDGMNLKVVATAIGKASAIKMCRSIVIKGIEALVVECFLTARRYGIEDTIIQSLNSSFPGTDRERRDSYMMSRVLQHRRRRAAELREAATTIQEAGFIARMAPAAAEVQEWVAVVSPRTLGTNWLVFACTSSADIARIAVKLLPCIRACGFRFLEIGERTQRAGAFEDCLLEHTFAER